MSYEQAAAALDRLGVPRRSGQSRAPEALERVMGHALPGLLRAILRSHELAGFDVLSARLLCDAETWRSAAAERRGPARHSRQAAGVPFAIDREGNAWRFDSAPGRATDDPEVFFSAHDPDATRTEAVRFSAWLSAGLALLDIKRLAGPHRLLSDRATHAVLTRCPALTAITETLPSELPY